MSSPVLTMATISPGSTTACRPASILAAPTPPQRTAITKRPGGRGRRPPPPPLRSVSRVSSRGAGPPASGRASSVAPHRAGPAPVAAFESLPQAFATMVVQLGDRGLLGGADVHHEASAAARGAGEGIDDVVHEHVVAGLAPVSEDDAGPARDEVAGEDGHHAGLAVGVLTGAVDVGEGQGGELDPVQLPICDQVVDGRLLRHAVGRQRPVRLVLVDGQVGAVRLAIERAPRGREDDLSPLPPRVRPPAPGSCRGC